MQTILYGLRKKFKESQKDIAHLLCISESSYRSRELGNTQFKMNEMFLLSKHFGQPIEDIFLPCKNTNRDL